MSYDVLASCYDSFVGVNYDDLSALIMSVFQSFDINGEVLDLACGTGELSLRLNNAGYKVTGLDLSDEMLKRAREKCQATFVKGDMTDFSLDNPFRAVVCTLDCINHLRNIEDVKKTFACVYNSLDVGGVFIFDVNSPYKHKEILADNSFVYEDEQNLLVWRNDYDERLSRVGITLDLFKSNGDCYKRESESFFEYDYSLEEICSALEQCGFNVIDVSSEYEMEEVTPDTERYFIISGR
ncbi:MAG: class I SAM-dependent methyltransferase [Ruminococcus sp.]|nr:class I SAM-dependent methyltransferase [Ruminococcus sp.]